MMESEMDPKALDDALLRAERKIPGSSKNRNRKALLREIKALKERREKDKARIDELHTALCHAQAEIFSRSMEHLIEGGKSYDEAEKIVRASKKMTYLKDVIFKEGQDHE